MWIPPIDPKALPPIRKKRDAEGIQRKKSTPEAEEKSEANVLEDVASDNLEYEHDVIYHRPKHKPKDPK